MKELKIVVLGIGGVGKSAITVQYVQNLFIEKYDPTIEDSYRKHVDIDGESYMLEILDTAGTEQFAAMRELYMQSGNGFLLVYDITNISTLRSLNEIIDSIINIKGTTNIPIVIAANKCDLRSGEEANISSEQSEVINRPNLDIQFINCSAKNRLNIDEAFANLIRSINRIEGKNKQKKKKSGCSLL